MPNVEVITYGIPGLMIRQKDQLTGLYVTDTLDFTRFYKSLYDFTNIDFIRVVPKATCNKDF